jgi:L-ascorbate metabolism protein UlaG (beta-lactamase superfamily)
MKLIYHGHSCVQITEGSNSVIIDPFISGNPAAVAKAEDIQVQYVLLTHGHGDHTADAEAIARANDATIIATFELATHFAWKGLKTIAVNIGGTVDLGFAKAKMVQAFHSSSIVDEETKQIIYMGMPGGFLLYWNDLTVYHAGDTSLFRDMKLIGRRNEIDYALLPIGDLFTMGPEDALTAARWLRAKHVIPVHHSTFPPIQQDAAEFARQLEKKGIIGLAMKPGEEIELKQAK